MKKIIVFLFAITCFLSKNAFAQPANDNCATAQNLGTLPSPAACSGTAQQNGAPVNVAGTLVGATPGSPYIYQPGCTGGSMAVPANDVWYSFTASSYQMVATVTSTFGTPNIAMYSGTCGALGGGVGGCAVGAGTSVTLTVEQMVPGTTYYLQVSGATGATGTFNLSVQNNKDCADCLNASTFTATPLPTAGMYAPGTVVNFCYHVGQYTQINTNWLHGVQMTFGAGWNLATLTTSPPPACQGVGTGTWAYYPAGCTSTATGIHFGPGFYFDTSDPGTNPGDNFGDNCSGVQGAGTWNFCFSIAVANGCSPGSNLDVTINTSGDGESGSWSNAGCLDDPASVLPATGACCIPTMSSTPAPCGGTGTATATPVGASGPYNYVWTNSVGATVSSTTGAPGANTASGLPAGTYTVTMTNNALGCVVTNTVTVAGGGSITAPTAGSNSPVCVGGTLNLTSTTVAGATYSWTGPGAFASGVQNPSIAGVTATAAGTYTVVANSGGCTASGTVTVVINPNPTVTVPPNITVCSGGNVPATAFTSTPGGATYTWTNTNAAIGVAASGSGNLPSFTATNGTGAAISGTITVTPTLAGCTGPSSSYTITVNPMPTVTVPANITVCNGGAVPASVFTSTPGGGTFAWTNSNATIGLAASGSGNTPAFTASNAGAAPITATITVTPTVAGCPGTPNSYTITVNPTPTVTVPANITICNGGNIPASAFASTPAGGTFTWINSNSTIGLAASGSGNTPAFTAVNAGASPVTATITVTPTVAGCPGTPNSYTITINPTPPAPTAAGAIVCINNSATLTATAPGGTYQWYDAPGGTLLITNATYTTPTLSVNTTYYVQTTLLGCTGPFTPVTVTIAPGLTPVASPDDTICFGTSTVISVTPTGAGYTYSWSPSGSLSNAAISNPTASPATTTTYTVTVTDPGGCVGTDQVTVYADPQLTTAIAGIDVTCNGACNGQTIVIPAGGTPGYTYSWTGGCTSAACNSLCPGSYTVTVTDSWGCTATNDTSVVQPTLLTASITGSTPASCNGTCDGTASAAGNGGTVGYTYSWNTVPVQNTATAVNLCAGSYTCTVTDANSCTATATVTITQPTVVTIAPIASVIICSGGSTTLTAIAAGGNGGPYVYSWSPATGLSATNIANPTASPAVTTVYTVNATDANGCPAAPVNVTVTVNPPLTVVAAGTASICPGTSTVITAVAANGNGGPYTYSWSPTTGLSNPAIANPSASPAVTTVYTVTATDGCSPAATATVTVTVLPLPVVSFSSPAAGCSPLCVTFTDNSTVTGSTIASWAWDFGDGSTGSTPVVNHCYADNTSGVNQSYNVSLTVTSTLGGCSSSLTMPGFVTVYSTPDAQFSSSTGATILEPVINFTDQSTNDVVYWNWYFGDGDSLGYTTPNPSHSYPNAEAGNYQVTLYVMNAQGCMDSITQTVVVGPEFTFFIPNAFSPNGDGVNDYFQGKGVGIKKYEIMIFDRWGNMIWYTDDINKQWDGKANHGDEMAQQDVYVWKVRLTDVFDKKHSYIGTVTIVK
ncbi:MAG: PKD domain-containing protein [Bacteroidia bacterium]